MTITRLLVNRSAFDTSRIDYQPFPALSDGEVLVKTGKFALTANNVTYAVAGDMIGYWQFFPVDAQWGMVPVWGHGEVIQSHCDEVSVGDRIWGFLPTASHVVMRPARVRDGGFIDGAEHRQSLPPVYNDYVKTNHDPANLEAIAELRSLLFPLLITSYLIADYCEDNALFGVEQVIISSASSKTAIGTAHYLGHLANRPKRIIGLTSAPNISFTESLGVYDEVISYEDIQAISNKVATAFIDMAGDSVVRSQVHHHSGDNLKSSIGVGITHWDVPRDTATLPGAVPTMFFAPAQIVKRNADLGKGVLLARAQEANIAFAHKLAAHIEITSGAGALAVQTAYEAMAKGETPPTKGIIVAF